MEERLKKILGEVAEIGQMIEQLKSTGPVPSIEVDLVLEKIRRLYEHTRDLGQIPATPVKKVPVAEPVTEKSDPESLEKKEPAPSGTPVTEKPAETDGKEKGNKDREAEILADKYKGERKYINETLSRNDQKQDITSKLQSKPIKSIQSSLGINDRFKLIGDLFNGDKKSFEDTMVILDNAGNFNEAFSYLTSSFEWDIEDEAVQMLLDLVRRKFIVNQDEA